jgi:serine phosphatase RsbU (regulator of sigma subunit)
MSEALSADRTWRQSSRRGDAPYVRLAVLGALLLAHVLLAINHFEPPWRIWWFDTLQRAFPRAAVTELADSPVRIVAVQEANNAEDDQAIWPRDRIARLVDQVGNAGAAVIGLDIMLDGLGLFEVADAQSGSIAGPDKTIYLAEVISEWPVVSPVVMFEHEGQAALHTRRITALDLEGYGPSGPDPLTAARAQDLFPQAPRLPGSARAHPALVRASKAEGATLNELGGGQSVRALPVVQIVQNEEGPAERYTAMPVEMVRLKKGVERIAAQEAPLGDVTLSIDTVDVPLDTRGDMRLNLRKISQVIYMDGEDVYRGRFDPAFFAGKYVIIAASLGDNTGLVGTPLFDRAMPAEIFAQAIEQIESGAHVIRPGWAVWVELVLMLVLGLVVIVALPSAVPAIAIPATTLMALTALPISMLVLSGFGVLIDGLSVTGGLLTVGAVVFGATLIDRDRQHQEIQVTLLRERAAKSRLEGELDVARRIQMGLLPAAEARPAQSLEIACHVAPARVVGGDFYDHIVRSDGQVFFLIADVSGKGVPASLFMALAKSLWKSAALRCDNLGDVQALADLEISRDNKDKMFVTGVACVFDPNTQTLSYCGAGHDMPVIARPGKTAVPLPDAAGPPLGLGSNTDFPVGTVKLERGDMVCLYTDGLSEAELTCQSDGTPLTESAPAFFGAHGVASALETASDAGQSAQQALTGILRLLDQVTFGSEQTDDRTLVIVRAL